MGKLARRLLVKAHEKLEKHLFDDSYYTMERKYYSVKHDAEEYKRKYESCQDELEKILSRGFK